MRDVYKRQTQYPGLLAMGGRKYQIHGNIIRPAEESAEDVYKRQR